MLFIMRGMIALQYSISNIFMLVVLGVQGIGAAGIAPLVMIIIGDIVPLRERGKYQASPTITILHQKRDLIKMFIQ